MREASRVAALLMLSSAALGADGVRDPMRPDNLVVPRAVQARAVYIVSAIFQAGGQRVAIVNDRPVRAGELVGAARVLTIDERQVELLTANGRQVVSLKTRKD